MVEVQPTTEVSTPRSAPTTGPSLSLRMRTLLRLPNLVLGVCIGLGWFALALRHVWNQPIEHDARGYLWLAQAIVEGRTGSGVPAQYLDTLFNIRLAGYPLFLTPFVALGLTDLKLRLAVAGVQLALYIASVFLLRSTLRRVTSNAVSDRVAFALLILPYVYFAAVELLTEALVITGAIAAFACVLGALGTKSSRARWGWAVGVTACAGFVMLVRTDSVFVPVFGFVGLTCAFASQFGAPVGATRVGRLRRWIASGAISGILIGFGALVWRIPQFIVQAMHNGRGAWSTPTNVGGGIFRFGVPNIKWATGIEGITGGFPYRNPFLTTAMMSRYGDNPLRWYGQEPLLGAAYVALKFFARIDQDVPFAFNSVMPSRPSIPLFIVNHVFVGLGAAGLVLIAMRAASRNTARTTRFVAFTALAGAGTWLATHALPHAESRYGLPALVALAACAGLWASRNRLQRYWIATTVGLAVYLVVAWQLSTWLITYRTGPV